jgi:hypothetical protein
MIATVAPPPTTQRNTKLHTGQSRTTSMQYAAMLALGWR